MSAFKTKPLDYYRRLTNGGKLTIDLSQDEACAALKAYDYGADELTDHEALELNRLLGKLKGVIWP